MADSIPLHPVVDPTKTGDHQTGPQVDRFSGVSSGGWRVFAEGITAAQSLPTTPLQCVSVAKHQRVQWLVLVPPGATDYTVSVVRWITTHPQDPKSKALLINKPVIDETKVAGGAVDVQTYQRPERDHVGAFITSITGAPTDPPAGVTRPNNPPMPDGFIVLWRPATRE